MDGEAGEISWKEEYNTSKIRELLERKYSCTYKCVQQRKPSKSFLAQNFCASYFYLFIIVIF